MLAWSSTGAGDGRHHVERAGVQRGGHACLVQGQPLPQDRGQPHQALLTQVGRDCASLVRVQLTSQLLARGRQRHERSDVRDARTERLRGLVAGVAPGPAVVHDAVTRRAGVGRCARRDGNEKVGVGSDDLIDGA
jgi:hypothetical protein